ISDTTIAVTRSLEIDMKEKFKENIKIVAPLFFVTIFVTYFMGTSGATAVTPKEFEIIKALPYLLILVLALIGVEVFTVLTIGIVSLGVMGFFTEADFGFLNFTKYIYEGFT